VARRYGFIVVWRVPSLSFRRSTSLLTSHGDSAFGRSCTTSSNARKLNTITQRFGHWHTNGFGFYSGAGRIVGYTMKVDTRNRSSSAEPVWHRCLTCRIVEMACRSCEPGLDKQPQMSTVSRLLANLTEPVEFASFVTSRHNAPKYSSALHLYSR